MAKKSSSYSSLASVKKDTTVQDIDTQEVINNTEEEVIDNESKEITDIIVDTTDETKAIENIVNSKSEKTAPIYQIRVDWDNISTQKESFTDINKAIIECNKYPGYKVFNQKGIAIHLSTAPIPMSSNNNDSVIYPGKKYELKRTKLFASSTIDRACGLLTGTYYLYDAVLINGRYRIVDKKSKVESGLSNVLGYIAVEEM